MTASLFILHTGIPIAYAMPGEKGLLFASASLAIGLVLTVALPAARVIPWETGAMP